MDKRQVGNFRDSRGILLWASPKLLGFDFKYLTTGSIEPECLRGGHYHKKTLEQFMCVAGRITAYLDNETATLEPGDIVNIPANAVHTFVNEGSEAAYFIEFKNVEFDKNDPDTYKVDIGHLRKGKK
ncbi:TPA: cupin domain-containing protein [Candidatus Woesearchaeota archaeon]|nr:cupin domain-containing protein [Candidatus Woesearchaeota archaeon]